MNHECGIIDSTMCVLSDMDIIEFGTKTQFVDARGIDVKRERPNPMEMRSFTLKFIIYKNVFRLII